MESGDVAQYDIQRWLEAFKVNRYQVNRQVVFAHIPVFIASTVSGFYLLPLAGFTIPATLICIIAANIIELFVIRELVGFVADQKPDKRLIRQVQDSKLVERLLRGEISGNETASNTPEPFRRLITPVNNPSPERILTRVVPSLSWYSGPPRRHWRSTWSWVLFYSLLFLLPVCLIQLNTSQRPMTVIAIVILVVLSGLAAQTYTHLTCLSLLEGEFKDRATGFRLTHPKSYRATARHATEITPTHRGLLPILNQLEQDLQSLRLLFRNPYTMIPGFMFLNYLSPLYLTKSIKGIFLFTISGVLMQFSLAGWDQHDFSAGDRRLIRYRLEHSRLYSRLAATSPAQCLEEWQVPPPLRWLAYIPILPRGYSDNLRCTVWFAAANLDWLLEPPRRGVRLIWVLLPVQFALLAGILILPWVNATSVSVSWLAAAEILGYLVLVFSIPGVMYLGRQLVWKRELIDYLRR